MNHHTLNEGEVIKPLIQKSLHETNRIWHFQALPKKALWKMRISAFLNSLVWVIFLSIISIALKFMLAEIEFATLGTIAGVLAMMWVLLMAIYWFTTALEYNYTAFHLDDEGLVIRKGMLWRSETFVLRTRVQHIDVAQDPLARLLDLASIKVYTAGTKLGCISLSGLDKVDAEYIRNELISQSSDTL